MTFEHSYSDELLLKRIAEDDERSFRIIFERYKKRFYIAAIKMTYSTDVSEEIVQDVFVSIWDRRSLLAEVKNPSGYLFTMLYNNIYAYLKKIAAEKRMKARFGEQANEGEYSMEEKLYEKEISQLVHKLIQQLPPRQQQVYVLSKHEGLSRNEIAQRLQLSPHTVKNHLQEAIKFMRTHAYKVFAVLLIGLFI